MSAHGEDGDITAEELMAELEADPKYVAQVAREDERSRRRRDGLRRAEAPLVEELRRAGFEVSSVWDLVNTASPYFHALPILLEHLERSYPDRVREGIARALAVGDAKFAWQALVRLYRKEQAGTDAKDGLAVALAAVSDDDVIDDVISLVRDPGNGESRLLLLRALKRSRAPHAQAALREFVDDPVLGQQARTRLGRAP